MTEDGSEDAREGYVRRSRPRTEDALLRYATTPRGAYRIKRAYRASKRMKS